jgi:hypothetical protein
MSEVLEGQDCDTAYHKFFFHNPTTFLMAPVSQSLLDVRMNFSMPNAPTL